MMGHRLYMHIMRLDRGRNERITNDYDVTNFIEYIQFRNLLDKSPAYIGGRNNGWREISYNGTNQIFQCLTPK